MSEIQRKPKDIAQSTLFDVEPNWKDFWWGMPAFDQQDARATKSIMVHFLTMDDFYEFAAALNVKLTPKAPFLWYPPQQRMNAEYLYTGPQVDSRYPVCIPSKGRWDNHKTAALLDKMGVSYRFFVEETEAEHYQQAVGEDRVVVMPFHDLGQGSIPARNFIWQWALEREYLRHWIMDDNIVNFKRVTNNRRVRVRTGMFFRAIEDFVDRYENVVLAGPHHDGFVKDRYPHKPPVVWNRRIYSCILIDTLASYRWRGKYNEDTDLSLRVLKDGHCTALFTALTMHKPTTAGGKGKPMKGGNTDTVYATTDHRLAFAQSLKDQHPDVVEVTWKFNRWHHHVDYSPFRNNQPILRAHITPKMGNNEYEMVLVRAAPQDTDDLIEEDNEEGENL
jgi:hypothetical protein